MITVSQFEVLEASKPRPAVNASGQYDLEVGAGLDRFGEVPFLDLPARRDRIISYQVLKAYSDLARRKTA